MAISVVLPVMAVLEAVVSSVVAPLQSIVKPAVVPATHALPVRTIMLSPETIMVAVVPLFEAVVLSLVTMPPATLVGHRRRCRA